MAECAIARHDPTIGDPTIGDPTIGDPTIGGPVCDGGPVSTHLGISIRC
jgi:hypothetical protein